MTSNKHFPNAIYANHDAKLEKKILPAVGGKFHFAHKIFAVVTIFINLVLENSLEIDSTSVV